jgi:hypothetical protein
MEKMEQRRTQGGIRGKQEVEKKIEKEDSKGDDGTGRGQEKGIQWAHKV